VEPKGITIKVPQGPTLAIDTISISPNGEQANIGAFVLYKTDRPDVLESLHNKTDKSGSDNWGQYSYQIDTYALLTVESNTHDKAVFKLEQFVTHSYFNFKTTDYVDDAKDRGLNKMTVAGDRLKLNATLRAADVLHAREIDGESAAKDSA
jgi:hypothetical protein